MNKINQNVIDCDYEKKSPLLRFADFINRKSIYKIFHGRKVVFFKNSNDELDYSSKKYKCSHLSVLFFIVTMPLLPLTMAIKGLSSENKLRKKDIKAIDFSKKAKASLRKKAKIDARLRKTAELQKRLVEEKNLEEAKKRIAASPLISSRKSPLFLRSGSLSDTSSSSSGDSSIDDEGPVTDTPLRQHTPQPAEEDAEKIPELILPLQNAEDVESGDEASLSEVKIQPLPSSSDVSITINDQVDIGAKFDDADLLENPETSGTLEVKDLEAQNSPNKAPARTVSQIWQDRQKIAEEWLQTNQASTIAKFVLKLGFGKKNDSASPILLEV